MIISASSAIDHDRIKEHRAPWRLHIRLDLPGAADGAAAGCAALRATDCPVGRDLDVGPSEGNANSVVGFGDGVLPGGVAGAECGRYEARRCAGRSRRSGWAWRNALRAPPNRRLRRARGFARRARRDDGFSSVRASLPACPRPGGCSMSDLTVSRAVFAHQTWLTLKSPSSLNANCSGSPSSEPRPSSNAVFDG